MPYREFATPLRGLVECGWTATPDAAGPSSQLVLPDGCMDLIWDGTEVSVAGPDTASHRARLRPGVTVAGLRFAPGALPSLLGVPASALRDQRVALADLHAGTARAVAARIAAAGSDPALVAARLVESVSALPGPVDAGTPALVARIAAGAGVAATADAWGCTPRTLHRRCRTAFGYGPAVLRRILRFRRAAALLHAGIGPAEAAARAGYADQPHLSREVRALAGMAPGQLGPGQPARGANRSTPLPSGSCSTA